MRQRFILSTILIPTVLATSIVAASAATKTTKKPATTNHATVGTSQLKGGFGEIGHTYTLGKEYPWNITLKSAEYSVDALRFGDSIYYPKADQKLLVLHFTVHNPQKSEALMRYDTFGITAVDAKDTNWEYIMELGAEKTHEKYGVEMKPAQKADVYAAILVPAAGEIPKIIVKSNDNLVIRYDLKGKVKGIPAPFADSKDKTGATALAIVPAQVGTYYPTGDFLLRLDSMAFSDQPIGDQAEEEGGSFNNLMVTMTAKNISRDEQVLRYDTFVTKMIDGDGVDVERIYTMFRAASDKDLDTMIKPDQEISFRFAFPIEEGITPKTLAISQYEDTRAYQFDVK